MKPGIYENLSWDAYREIKLPSPSLLKHGLRSMKRLKRAKDGELKGPSSKTVAVGQCVHCLVAGEMDRVAVMPAFELDEANVTATGKQSNSKATSYVKEASAKWIEENAGKQILSDVQFNTARKAYKELRKNRKAVELIDNSKLEVVVVAEIDGVKTMTRMDGLWLDKCRAWDLKTCPDVEPQAFYYQARRLGYFFQFAFHRLALRSLGYELQSYEIIAQEVSDDYDNGVIDVPFALLDVWEDKVKNVLSQYKIAERMGKWDGIYPAGIGAMPVPNWDMSSDEDIVQFEGLEPLDNDEETEVYF